MQEKPKRRDEKIVSGAMWSAILTGAVWTFLVSAIFLFTSLLSTYLQASDRFPFELDSLHTAYFAFFIFIAVFNAFNARTDKLNLFDNIEGNKNFLKILSLIAAVQVALVYIGGDIFKCNGLNGVQWGVALIAAVSIIPVDLLRKVVMGKILPLFAVRSTTAS
jgi:magnesium-transporting ATPase (P-type)